LAMSASSSHPLAPATLSERSSPRIRGEVTRGGTAPDRPASTSRPARARGSAGIRVMRREPRLDTLASRADHHRGAARPTTGPPRDHARSRATDAAAQPHPRWKRGGRHNRHVTDTAGHPGCVARREHRRTERRYDEHRGEQVLAAEKHHGSRHPNRLEF
jgi:hypothetical protein